MNKIPDFETRTSDLLKWLKEETTPTFHFSEQIDSEGRGGTYTRFSVNGKTAAKNGYGHVVRESPK